MHQDSWSKSNAKKGAILESCFLMLEDAAPIGVSMTAGMSMHTYV